MIPIYLLRFPVQPESRCLSAIIFFFCSEKNAVVGWKCKCITDKVRNVFDHDDWILASLSFALFRTLTSFSRRFRFILKESRMTFLLPEPRKKANCVCSTISPRQSFIFSLFWLPSVDFCDSTTGIVQKLLTLLLLLGSQFELRIPFILSTGTASDIMHDFVFSCCFISFVKRSVRIK